MKKKITLLITILLISCSEEKKIKNNSINPKIKNIEIKSLNKTDFSYSIKISNGFQEKSIIRSENTSFIITKNNEKYTGNSESFEYNQEKKIFTFKNISIKNKDLIFKSDLLEFNEDKGINNSSKLIIKDINFEISGNSLKSDKKLQIFTLNKIKSRFRY